MLYSLLAQSHHALPRYGLHTITRNHQTDTYSRQGLTPLGRLQKYPKIHVNTGEESSGSGPTPPKVLGPSIDVEESREAHEQLARGLAFPEATRAGP